jgi:hypothetical protein
LVLSSGGTSSRSGERLRPAPPTRRLHAKRFPPAALELAESFPGMLCGAVHLGVPLQQRAARRRRHERPRRRYALAYLKGQFDSAVQRSLRLADGRTSQTDSPSFHGISYTVVSSAMPRSAARRIDGRKLWLSRIFAAFGSSTTGWVTKIAREEARPCTRAAMFTVCPK